jgi:WhiB family redox-sensing transcriptional regulator
MGTGRPISLARCADPRATYNALFFSEDRGDIARSKAICVVCTARALCFEMAVARREPCGVWGGAVFVDGVPVAEKRGRGRPPRRPQHPLVVDEIPDVA